MSSRLQRSTHTSAARESKTVLQHDPDDARGCIACPLFDGVPRDGGCRGLNGRTLDYDGTGRGRFAAPPECPLRSGTVIVRGRPLTTQAEGVSDAG